MKINKANIQPLQENAIGGGLEGAERTSRETLLWNPSNRSADALINPVKDMADNRARDIVQNDGYALGAVAIHRDSIVGSQYRLNAQPNNRVLNAPDGWAEEFQKVVEARFNLVADSPENWFDVQRMGTLTDMIRLAVGGMVMSGEVVGSAEWITDDSRRPFKTAIQMISPSRLSNPDGVSDSKTLRRGVECDRRGRPIAYHFRSSHPGEVYWDTDLFTWNRVPAETPWGRKQVIHIIERLMPDQHRGIADMVATLKQMRMTKSFQEVVLQNAVINASYAAAVESELPSELIWKTLGAPGPNDAKDPIKQMLGSYLDSLAAYSRGGNNIAIDGSKIPHLFPGTKLNLKPIGTPGGVGTGFEESLLRHIASSLGLSYEQFSRDYSKTNYSSARASMGETWKYMQSRKKVVADRLASHIYALWLEEEISAGNVPLPPGARRDTFFYKPMHKDALCQCSWIGASRGQIDELKETQAALLRINAGFSTREKEIARLGEDFREVFDQLAREQKLADELGLTFAIDAQKPGANMAQQTLTANNKNEDNANE